MFGLHRHFDLTNNLVIDNGISDGAFDSAMNQAFGNTAAGEALPYLSSALAIRNFADNPEQGMLTGAGTYVSKAANDDDIREVA